MPQQSSTRWQLMAAVFVVLGASTALASPASAGALATLHASPAPVPAGGKVTLFGTNYSNSATSTPVQIHLDERDGPIIAEFPPPPDRRINATVTIPANTAVGVHTLIATQYTGTGNGVSGTPGRATVTVTVAPRSTGESGADPAATAADSAAAPVGGTSAVPAAQAAVAARPASAAATVNQDTAAAPAAAAPAAAAPASIAAATAAPTADDASASADPAAAATTAPVAAAADQSAPAAAEAAHVDAGLLAGASSEQSSVLPGITLVAGLALVVLGIGASARSGRNVLGRSLVR